MERQIQVRIPRIDAATAVDGQLDEPVWSQAALLTGFSQYQPVDGTPAVDSTEVLVWYSPSAIHFGIRAFEVHGSVHATLADRDRIGADDNVQIYLGTFHDGRQALVFGVNPHGVQMDGTLFETGAGGNAGGGRETPDLDPDFVWQSKGQLTEWGYQVEIAIPFKSLRYQPAREQSWGLAIVRDIKHSGFEDSWTPASRAAASFLAQSGELVGLTDLHRGLVLDVTPEVTSRVTGAPGSMGAWDYNGGRPDLGGTARWGITNNLTLGATANPDFSQVESDAGQFSFDPRQAVSFPEKRPFFLEGSEAFDVPNNLIYTRSIVQPVGALKLTGKAFGTTVGLLSAVDQADTAGGSHPVSNILRLQKDVAGQSRLGLLYTDREDGSRYNRVAGVDGRLVFGRIYTLQFQGAGSITGGGGSAQSTAPLWFVRAQRTGRTFGARYTFAGVADDFRAEDGFISRAGIAQATIDHSITGYGRPGSPAGTVHRGRGARRHLAVPAPDPRPGNPGPEAALYRYRPAARRMESSGGAVHRVVRLRLLALCQLSDRGAAHRWRARHDPVRRPAHHSQL